MHVPIYAYGEGKFAFEHEGVAIITPDRTANSGDALKVGTTIFYRGEEAAAGLYTFRNMRPSIGAMVIEVEELLWPVPAWDCFEVLEVLSADEYVRGGAMA